MRPCGISQTRPIHATKAGFRLGYESATHRAGGDLRPHDPADWGLSRRRCQGEHLTGQGIRPHARLRKGDCRDRTAGLSIDRVKEPVRLAPASAGTNIARSPKPRRATGPTTRAHLAQGRGQKETKNQNAHAYLSLVRHRTICLDSPDAPAHDGHPAVLPDQRLHELPRAPARARPGRLRRLRVHPPARLTDRLTD